MLPPVRAALNLNIDYQGFTPASSSRQLINVAPAPANAEADGAIPLSGGRLDLLSLSAQLKLAHSFSVFAETIGQLLKMPRRENEALADYTERLSNALQALKPSERAAIERLLNDILKGTTLRLLAEILKNPAGPEAARLAVYMETSNPGERDLAARAVVSSYRQNGSADTALGSSAPRTVPVTGQSVQQAGMASPRPGSATVYSPALADGQAAPRQVMHGPVTAESEAPVPAPADRPEADKGEADEPTVPKPATREQLANNPVREAARFTPIGMRFALTGEGASIPVRMERASLHSTEAHPQPSGEAAHGEIHEERSLNLTSTKSREGDVKMPVHRVGPSARGEVASPQKSPLPAKGDRIQDLSNLLTDLLSEAEAPETGTYQSPLSGKAAAQSQLGNATLPNGSTDPAVSKEQSMSLVDHGVTEPTQLHDEQPAADIRSERPTGAAPASTADPILQAASLAMALPLVAREGLPWAYVAYPPAKDEPRREERKARPTAAIGDDEEDASSHDDGFQGERQDEPTDEDDPSRENAPTPDDEEGRPNDLYWRMAGWT